MRTGGKFRTNSRGNRAGRRPDDRSVGAAKRASAKRGFAKRGLVERIFGRRAAGGSGGISGKTSGDRSGGGAKGRSRDRSGGFRPNLLGALMVVCALIPAIVALDYWSNAGEIYGGVKVGAVDLGSKSSEQAAEILKSRTSGTPGSIKLSGPGALSLSPGEVGANYDVKKTVSDAYSVGRRGGLFERLGERARASFGGVEVPMEVSYRSREVRAQIERVASRLDEKPRDASVDIDGADVRVSDSREGYDLDVDETLSNVERSLQDLTGEAKLVGGPLDPRITTPEAQRVAARAREAVAAPITLTSSEDEWELAPDQIGSALDVEREGDDLRVDLRKGGLGKYMGDMYDELNVAPKEAGFDIEGDDVSVTPGKSGRKIEDEKFFDALKSGVFSGKRNYRVPVAEEKPKLTTAEAKQQKPTTLLSSYKTNYLTYDDTEGRVKNLDIAAQAVSGTAVAPDEVFSFNELAAPLDYYDTKVIIDGRADTAAGGGLCQVSSTLYMAANYAGMDTIERQPHYAELPYIRPGFDATVWFGAIDYKFKNTSDNYILLREWVDRSTGMVHAEIWGRPNGTDVQMNSRKVASYDDSEGNPVTEWLTYKTITKDGEVLFDGVVNDDTYKYLKPAEDDAPTERPPN